ncbi:hypothetical protein ACFCYM_08265 [Streptomyces sp. NPDC056254]|uniref:hypothetical protein n=1 Tax=Streptomyces sp. NPDC056254 TaxID=3345763 RepID=UPI0035DE9E30
MPSEHLPSDGPGARPEVERRSLLRLGPLLAAGGAAALVPAPVARAATRGQGTATETTTTCTGRSPYGNDQGAYVPFDVPVRGNAGRLGAGRGDRARRAGPARREEAGRLLDPFVRVPGPNGAAPFPAGQVAVAALPYGTTHVTAVGAR